MTDERDWSPKYKNMLDDDGIPTRGSAFIEPTPGDGLPMYIRYQNGPVKVAGRNGVQVDDVLQAALQRLEFLQEKFPCVENALTISSLKTAVWWQEERTRRREAQGVEGLNKPHDEGARWQYPDLDEDGLLARIKVVLESVGLQDAVVYINGIIDFGRTLALGINVHAGTAAAAFPKAGEQ